MLDAQRIFCFFVIDQFREEYLTTVSEIIAGVGGYERLSTVVEADYFPNVTPVGHATLSTGTTPSVHGIVGYEWEERGAIPPRKSSDSPEVLARMADDAFAVALQRSGYEVAVLSAKETVSRVLLGSANGFMA